MEYQPWDDHGKELRFPTWAYAWDVVQEFNGDTEKDYVRYTNEFDELTPEQVIAVMISSACSFIETLHPNWYSPLIVPIMCR